MIFNVILDGKVQDDRDVPNAADLQVEAESVKEVLKKLVEEDSTPENIEVGGWDITITGLRIEIPKDEEDCELCEGEEEVNCGDCDGTGEVSCGCGGNNNACVDCEGTDSVECEECNGMGTISCPECQ